MKNKDNQWLEEIRQIVRHHDQTLAPKGEYEKLLDNTVAKIQAHIDTLVREARIELLEDLMTSNPQYTYAAAKDILIDLKGNK